MSAPQKHRLRLHGDAHLRRADGSTVPLGGRSAALLALVALEPGIRRERAAQLLWPEATNPRQNLRQQLLRLRAALDLTAIDGDEALQLAADIALEPAAAGSELLAGEVATDEPFGLWLAQQRARTLRSQREPLQAELQAAEHGGDLARALELAAALVEIEPDAEVHHQALMRLHYLRGESAAGLAAYKRLAERMRVQFGTTPSRASDELADALRRGAVVAPPPAAAGAGASSSLLPLLLKRPPRLVGRSAELAAARTAWAEGRVVLLEGEAGLGKSRLIAELVAARAGPLDPGGPGAPQRVGLLLGSGRPGDGGAPYATLARWLAPLMAAESARADLPAPAQAALAHLGADTAPRPRSEFRPGALQQAVLHLLARHGVHTVVLDDLHFADDATLDLVAGLTADTASPTQRWLLAQRPAEAPAAARALRTALTELRRLDVVPLRPLDARATAELVAGLAIDGLDATTLAPALARHSGGNPLFLLETLKLGLHDGSLLRGELPRPASVGALIEHRLARLSEPALALARVAAIAGVDFGIEFAEAAIGQSAVQLASAWDELQQAQVLREEGFAHDLVADAVLRGVPAVVARRVHAQCAAWLEQRGGEPARVARHWQEGGDALRAARSYMRAGQRAREASRRTEAGPLYAAAAECFAAAGQPADRFEAEYERLDALSFAQPGAAMIEQAEALAALATSPRQAVKAARLRVVLLTNAGRHAEAIESAEKALRQARQIGAIDEQLYIAVPMLGSLSLLGRAHEPLEILLPLQAWAEREAAPTDRAMFLNKLASSLGDLGRLRESVETRARAAQVLRESGPMGDLGTTLHNAATCLGLLGAMAEAVESAAEAVELLPQETQGPLQHAIACFTHGRYLAEIGRYAPALDRLQFALDTTREVGAEFWPEAAALFLAQLWLRLAQPARAQPYLHSESDRSPARLRAMRRILRATALVGTDREQAAAVAAEARSLLTLDQPPALAVHVAALRFLGDPETLARAPALLEQAQRQERIGVQLSAFALLARAAARTGQSGMARDAIVRWCELSGGAYWPDSMTRAEESELVWRAACQVGMNKEARQALHQGVTWLQQQALPHVPAPLVDAFVHRHPTHRLLLSEAARS